MLYEVCSVHYVDLLLVGLLTFDNVLFLAFFVTNEFTCIPEDTVVAVSVTGILKVWIITADVSRMQVCSLH